MQAVIENIVPTIKRNKDLLMDFSHLRLIDGYTYDHSIDVCALALIMGYKLKYTKTELYNLGLGALLHDIGKSKLPFLCFD